VFGLREPSEDDDARQIIATLEKGPLPAKVIADTTNIALRRVIMAASVLAKMGLVSVRAVSTQ
jgi:predicted Rossmann fold nucleotide-binding protein DprA/Smf involved in DNA uptake